MRKLLITNENQFGLEAEPPQGQARRKRNETMRRIAVLLSVAAVVLVGPLAPGRFAWGTVAQEAAPPAETAPPVAGATLEILDSGPPVATPGKVLNFARVTLEPGGYVGAHGHPGAQIWYIDTGTVDTTIHEGTVRLTRAAIGGTPTSAEQAGPAAEVTMSVGDTLFFDHDVVHTVRNEGDTTAVILIGALFTADEPEVIFAGHTGDADHPSHEETPAP